MHIIARFNFGARMQRDNKQHPIFRPVRLLMQLLRNRGEETSENTCHGHNTCSALKTITASIQLRAKSFSKHSISYTITDVQYTPEFVCLIRLSMCYSPRVTSYGQCNATSFLADYIIDDGCRICGLPKNLAKVFN